MTTTPAPAISEDRLNLTETRIRELERLLQVNVFLDPTKSRQAAACIRELLRLRQTISGANWGELPSLAGAAQCIEWLEDILNRPIINAYGWDKYSPQLRAILIYLRQSCAPKVESVELESIRERDADSTLSATTDGPWYFAGAEHGRTYEVRTKLCDNPGSGCPRGELICRHVVRAADANLIAHAVETAQDRRALLTYIDSLIASRLTKAEPSAGVEYHVEPSYPPNQDQFDIVDGTGATLAWRLTAANAQAILAALTAGTGKETQR